jgi:hypothetical protein
MRKPAVVQRVINSQINEIVGGGRREAIPDDMLPRAQRGRHRRDGYDDVADTDQHDTPPFGVNASAASPASPRASESHPRTDPGSPAGSPVPPQGAVPFEIRDRLIELDDLRKRGIISEEEFAAKKSQLLDRI